MADVGEGKVQEQVVADKVDRCLQPAQVDTVADIPQDHAGSVGPLSGGIRADRADKGDMGAPELAQGIGKAVHQKIIHGNLFGKPAADRSLHPGGQLFFAPGLRDPLRGGSRRCLLRPDRRHIDPGGDPAGYSLCVAEGILPFSRSGDLSRDGAVHEPDPAVRGKGLLILGRIPGQGLLRGSQPLRGRRRAVPVPVLADRSHLNIGDKAVLPAPVRQP